MQLTAPEGTRSEIQASLAVEIMTQIMVEGRASFSSCHQTAAPNMTSLIFFKPTQRPARLLSAGYPLRESIDKKSLVRRGSGQELCIHSFACQEPPGCLSSMPLDVHCLGTCLGSSPVQ